MLIRVPMLLLALAIGFPLTAGCAPALTAPDDIRPEMPVVCRSDLIDATRMSDIPPAERYAYRPDDPLPYRGCDGRFSEPLARPTSSDVEIVGFLRPCPSASEPIRPDVCRLSLAAPPKTSKAPLTLAGMSFGKSSYRVDAFIDAEGIVLPLSRLPKDVALGWSVDPIPAHRSNTFTLIASDDPSRITLVDLRVESGAGCPQNAFLIFVAKTDIDQLEIKVDDEPLTRLDRLVRGQPAVALVPVAGPGTGRLEVTVVQWKTGIPVRSASMRRTLVF